MKKDIRFDDVPDRTGTHSMKWEKYEGTDILPMWVADMDFKAPPQVLQALTRTIAHGVLGYTNVPDRLNRVVTARLKALYDWEVNPEWLVWTPGVVSGLNATCRAVGTSDQVIVTTTPIYPPFLSVSHHSGKELITLPMILDQDRATLDFAGLEKAFARSAALFLFCSPYNPCGTLFNREELERLVALCDRYGVSICSDEIHSDFVLDEANRHIPTATISSAAAKMTVTLMAPSKTYNIPGLGCSFAVIPDPLLREQYRDACRGIMPDVNLMGYAAARAAYEECDDWLAGLITYLRENRDTVLARVNAMPGCRVLPIHATYLAWIDIRETGLEDPVAFFEQAGVGLSDGKFFGRKGFVRLNFGCPASTLTKGLDRMETALKNR